MSEPIKRLPKLSSESKSRDLRALLGIFALAAIGALVTIGLLRLLPYLIR